MWSLDVMQQKAEPVLQSPANEVQPRLSPNGRWLAYASDETGMWEVYVRGVGGTKGRFQVSRGGGIEPTWRGDSGELFYVGPSGMLNAVKISGVDTMVHSAPVPLFQTTMPSGLAPFRSSYAVSPDGQHFLLNSLRSNPQASVISVLLNALPK